MKKAAIIGAGQTTQEGCKIGATFADMTYDAVRAALDDAGLTIDQIDNVISVSNDFWDGRTISSMAISEASGAYGKNISTVEGDGTFGIVYGMMRALSGFYGTTLVCAHCKASESDIRSITNAMFDPIYQRMLGIDALPMAAIQARAYMERFGITPEQCAGVSVKNHRNALKNPDAQLKIEHTVEDVLNSEMISDPLHRLDCSPMSDGAAAVIIASPRTARELSDNPVWIDGIAYCADAYFPGDRDLAVSKALSDAAQRAYRMADITDPLHELDMAEVYDAFSYQELMWYEGLGLCEAGQGGQFMQSGATQPDGELPVNLSGGVLSAHTPLVAGLCRVIEAYRQIRGQAGPRQLDNVNTALAHGQNGLCGQSHCVLILGKSEVN